MGVQSRLALVQEEPQMPKSGYKRWGLPSPSALYAIANDQGERCHVLRQAGIEMIAGAQAAAGAALGVGDGARDYRAALVAASRTEQSGDWLLDRADLASSRALTALILFRLTRTTTSRVHT